MLWTALAILPIFQVLCKPLSASLESEHHAEGAFKQKWYIQGNKTPIVSMSYNKACKPQMRSRPSFAGHCTYKQDETGFPLLTDHDRGRKKGEDEGKGLVSMPSLAGAEPSSAFSLSPAEWEVLPTSTSCSSDGCFRFQLQKEALMASPVCWLGA